MTKAVLCLVDAEKKVQLIIQELHQAGFEDKDISVLHAEDKAFSKTEKSALTGASAGAIIGGALGILAGIGVVTIPEMGTFIASGTLLSTLAGAFTGSAVGGGIGLISGALIGWGLQNPEVQEIEEEIRKGKILIAVESDKESKIKRAIKAYKHVHAQKIHEFEKGQIAI